VGWSCSNKLKSVVYVDKYLLIMVVDHWMIIHCHIQYAVIAIKQAFKKKLYGFMILKVIQANGHAE
jgi:hypothetical protein